MGLHPNHNQNAEQTLKEFVNRESITVFDDLNADTILPLSMIEEPILLIFMDSGLWDTNPEQARIQRNFIDKVAYELEHEIHPKAAMVITPIDDTEFGNLAIRKMFGLVDNQEYDCYP